MAHQGCPSTSLVPDPPQPCGVLPRLSVAHALSWHSSGPQRSLPLGLPIIPAHARTPSGSYPLWLQLWTPAGFLLGLSAIGASSNYSSCLWGLSPRLPADHTHFSYRSRLWHNFPLALLPAPAPAPAPIGLPSWPWCNLPRNLCATHAKSSSRFSWPKIPCTHSLQKGSYYTRQL